MGSVTLAGRRAPRAIVVIAAIAAAACAACTGRTVSLGDKEPRPYHFETPKIVGELASTARTDNPTLTADLMEIYFTSDRVSNNGDVWFARRYDTNLPFGNPLPVNEVNTATFETSAAISADGLTLWFGSDRPGGVGSTDIWMSTRPNRLAAWSTPVNVIALNTAAEDIPRPPGQHGLVMPMASERDVTGGYRTFLAVRPDINQPFDAMVLVAGLVGGDILADAFLSDDGLTMFYAAAAGGAKPDMYVAWRASTADRFSLPTPLTDLNTAADERDPWLSPDGTLFYFTSDRGNGVLQIYEATARRTP